MIVAIVVDGKVENLIICESIELARQLLPYAVCVDGDGLAIGDTFEIEQPENESESE